VVYHHSVDYHNINLNDPIHNIQTALQAVEKTYNVPPLLNTDNLVIGKESDKNILLYLSLLHSSWSREKEKKKASQVTQEKVLTLKEKLIILEEENMSLKEQKTDLEEKVDSLTTILQKRN